jgi:hypothetical protein
VNGLSEICCARNTEAVPLTLRAGPFSGGQRRDATVESIPPRRPDLKRKIDEHGVRALANFGDDLWVLVSDIVAFSRIRVQLI